MYCGKIIHIKGRVQGVGFRPFIFALAHQFHLHGTVQNNMDGVKIFVEGKSEQIETFVQAIKQNKPRLAKIFSIETKQAPIKKLAGFTIIPSDNEGKSELVLPVDASACSQCLEELHDPENRRYMYPFINCTDCGPRYTIIEGLPYDRPYTTMASFEMCPACQHEYENPSDRRHHAQPNACPVCGPKYEFHFMDGQVTVNDAIEEAVRFLEDGKIVAIKGIGGYHLVCDATNQVAVRTLRDRKRRKHKPLAVMAKNVEALKQVCSIGEMEKKLLTSVEAPIVLCQKKGNDIFPSEMAPGLNTVGMMLPYAPVHSVLFAKMSLQYLVMTSANPSKLPMLYEDEKAFTYLAKLADGILVHNREIVHPIDDSVMQVFDHKMPQLIRRARGFAPEPKLVNQNVDGIVAMGSQQKNTFAVGRNQQVFVGPHIGDLDALEMMVHYQKEQQHLLRWFDIEPKLVVIDKHPLFSTRELAQDFIAPILEVQHHHAHMVSCMADHDALGEEAFGIVLDGTGYGLDGNIWGFEVLYGSEVSVLRKGHLQYTALPGGEKSILSPWKNTVGMLITLFGEQKGYEMACTCFPEKEKEIHVLRTMVSKGINSPLAGTCGRLFDAVSALIGICVEQDYDGEAAVLLSEQADLNLLNQVKPYAYEIQMVSDCYEISFERMISEIFDAVCHQEDWKMISSRFHQTIVCAICDIMMQLKNEYDTRKIFCSGGSFHNEFLATGLQKNLSAHGFQVYLHQDVPTNDGGLSLGQLFIGQSYLKEE